MSSDSYFDVNQVVLVYFLKMTIYAKQILYHVNAKYYTYIIIIFIFFILFYFTDFITTDEIANRSLLPTANEIFIIKIKIRF